MNMAEIERRRDRARVAEDHARSAWAGAYVALLCLIVNVAVLVANIVLLCR